MSTTTATTSATAHVTGWDRAVVIALGASGCALSFSALQQMAVAIHVRDLLTYLFPVIVDGFIAYGVRALLVLRDAPLRARIYVWTLFGAATGTSLWANALHAVRLNEQNAATGGLRLGDTVVAVLSTIAPLALAGAVHLYILIARGPVSVADRVGHGDRAAEVDRGQVTAGQTGLTKRSVVPVAGQDNAGHPAPGQPDSDPVTTPVRQPTSVSMDSLTTSSDPYGHSDTEQPLTDRPPVATTEVTRTEYAGQPVAAPLVTDRDGDPHPDLDVEGLLEIARQAVREEDKLTRKVVGQAIRGQQIPLSSATLTQLMAQLRTEDGQPVTASQS
ncbi:DUF2637 domain-containing protein [Kitasatospora sp. NPDC089509]|uniref:DUF2637 domain-containing protein n=1 Tax=Kitasatospora sp. NPDC089509 TaxID=3364079 RepID=UPI00381C2A0E